MGNLFSYKLAPLIKTPVGYRRFESSKFWLDFAMRRRQLMTNFNFEWNGQHVSVQVPLRFVKLAIAMIDERNKAFGLHPIQPHIDAWQRNRLYLNWDNYFDWLEGKRIPISEMRMISNFIYNVYQSDQPFRDGPVPIDQRKVNKLLEPVLAKYERND